MPMPDTHGRTRPFASSSAHCRAYSSFLTSPHGPTPPYILNPIDELKLELFLLPFVVAAMGSQVLGTPHSTVSRYTVDVLHQVYQGRDIIERGR
jgi:hypothetical protein